MICRRRKKGMVCGWGLGINKVRKSMAISYMIQLLYAMFEFHGSWFSLVNQRETLNERVAQASVWHECGFEYFDGKKIKTS